MDDNTEAGCGGNLMRLTIEFTDELEEFLREEPDPTNTLISALKEYRNKILEERAEAQLTNSLLDMLVKRATADEIISAVNCSPKLAKRIAKSILLYSASPDFDRPKGYTWASGWHFQIK